MTQGEAVDRLTEQMYYEAMDPKYEFIKYAAPWGSRYNDRYCALKVGFSKTMREFAKKSGVMAIGEDFYMFNGFIYEKIDRITVEQAYDRLLESLGIAEMMNNKTMRREVFMNTILICNQLHVENDVVCFKNKVVCFSAKDEKGMPVTSKPSPKFHVTDYHPYDYDPQAKCPIWKRFLREVLPNKIERDVLQMFLGLGLVQPKGAFGDKRGGPRGTVELCLLLLGGGSNGKSVLFNVIMALFGRNHITSLDYDQLTADGDEGLRARYTIRNATFNWSSDSDPHKFGNKNTAVFKQLVSGEPVTVRGIRCNVEELQQCPYLIFSMNELPKITDSSHGFIRRLQYVNFNVTIPRYRQDPNLAFKIISTELPGVFNWVLRGAMEIRRRKFQFPNTSATRKQIVATLFLANPVKSWMVAYGLRSEPFGVGELNSLIPYHALWESFRKFCEANSMPDNLLLNERKFSFALTSEHFIRVRRGGGVSYRCFGVSEDDLSAPIYIENIEEPDSYESSGSLIEED